MFLIKITKILPIFHASKILCVALKCHLDCGQYFDMK